MQFPENMWLIIFLSVSSWVSLKFKSVIIAVIIILIQSRNLSKYYTVDVTSLSHCGWRVPATGPAQPGKDGSQGFSAQRTARSECVNSSFSNSKSHSALHPSLILAWCWVSVVPYTQWADGANFLVEGFCTVAPRNCSAKIIYQRC